MGVRLKDKSHPRTFLGATGEEALCRDHRFQVASWGFWWRLRHHAGPSAKQVRKREQSADVTMTLAPESAPAPWTLPCRCKSDPHPSTALTCHHHRGTTGSRLVGGRHAGMGSSAGRWWDPSQHDGSNTFTDNHQKGGTVACNCGGKSSNRIISRSDPDAKTAHLYRNFIKRIKNTHTDVNWSISANK